MEKFDLVVIGAGSGLNISSAASDRGMKVAVLERGPMGGTCLNRGCIPSKIIIHSADVAEIIGKSELFGIASRISSVDFGKITSRASKIVDEEAKQIKQALLEDKNTTLYHMGGKFIGERTIQAGNETIKGEKAVIAAGTRPLIPPIEGLKDVDYMTSDGALRLTKQPRTMTILGGGYIAAELAHFYGSLGTEVSIIQKEPAMVHLEDEEVARKFTEIFGKKHNVHLNFEAKKVYKKAGKFVVEAHGRREKIKVLSEKLMVAAGRVPNSDALGLENTGVEVNEKNYVVTNDYLETTAKNIWALGDIAGKYFFKHSANLEAEYVYNNAVLGKREKVDYSAMPHAIFSSPQVAGVGLREQDLIAKKIDCAVGRYRYISSGMGLALQDKEGFVKIFADKKTRKILGCHILGTDASTVIHEVLVAMKNGLTADAIQDTIHIHPALSEVVQRAVNNIEW